MSKTQSFCVPIKVEIGVKKKRNHWLNLNNYRNWNFRLSNTLKKAFRDEVQGTIESLDKIHKPCTTHYTIYYPTKRLFDVDNIGSVVAKFTHDVLVEQDILVDDNYQYVTQLTYSFGGVDKSNPRCEVTITEET